MSDDAARATTTGETVERYMDRWPDSSWLIVGKGATPAAYENLREHEGPIIWINDAIQFSGTGTPGEAELGGARPQFWFAHDRCQRVWLQKEPAPGTARPAEGNKAVLAAEGAVDSAGKPLLSGADLTAGETGMEIITYQWGGWYGLDVLGKLTRWEVARTGRLHLNSGTIHTAIHFAWLAGASRVCFVGCDGFCPSAQTGYDRRLNVASGGRPGGARVFARIREAADAECEALGLETEYCHGAHLRAVAPRMAHFVWLANPGEPMPRWAAANVARFRAMHPGWCARVWGKLPAEMPAELRRAAADAERFCQTADILRYWLLWRWGGLYLDCDVVPLRPMDQLLRFDAVAGRTHCGRINNAVMACRRGAPAMAAAMRGCLEVARGRRPDGMEKTKQSQRARFGPNLLTKLFLTEGARDDRRANELAGECGLTVAPSHWFYPLIDAKEVARWRERPGSVDLAARQSDPVPPYCVHEWGRDGSGTRLTFARGEALAERLRQIGGEDGRVRGAEVGVLAGRLSEFLLRRLPQLNLLMVDRWAASEQASAYYQSGDKAALKTDEQMAIEKRHAIERTGFAAERRTIIHAESARAAEAVADGTLDFVFIDAEHTAAGCYRDIAAWAPKIRRGGLLSGHDIVPAPEGRKTWGVREAVARWMREQEYPAAALAEGGETTWFLEKR